jgi:hypothetical protein
VCPFGLGVFVDANMLSSNEKQTVKQGWMLKKAGSGLLASWKPKYLKVVQDKNSNEHILMIFDQRDTTKSAKHACKTSDIKITSDNGAFKRLKRGACPFTLFANSRKFYLAAHTRAEFDDWMNVLAPRNRGMLSSPSFSSQMSAPPLPPRQSRYFQNRDDSDAKSVYSNYEYTENEDDAISVASSYSRATSATQYEDDRASNVSGLETLVLFM